MKLTPYFEVNEKVAEIRPIKVSDSYHIEIGPTNKGLFKLVSYGVDGGGSHCYVFVEGNRTVICTSGARSRVLLIQDGTVRDVPAALIYRSVVKRPPITKTEDGQFVAKYDTVVAKRKNVEVGDVLSNARHNYTVEYIMENGSIVCVNAKNETVVIDRRDKNQVGTIQGNLKWGEYELQVY